MKKWFQRIRCIIVFSLTICMISEGVNYRMLDVSAEESAAGAEETKAEIKPEESNPVAAPEETESVSHPASADEAEVRMEMVDLSEFIFQEGGLSTFEDSIMPLSMDEEISMDEETSMDEEISPCSDADYAGAEEALLEACRGWEAEVDLSQYNISVDEMKSFYARFVNFHPELFYLTGAYSGWSMSGMITKIEMVYGEEYTQEDVQVYEEAFAKAYKEAVTSDNMTDLQKARAFHDYLAQHVEYDMELQRRDAYKTFVEGKAVCQGYSLAYAAMLKEAGIEFDFCTSEEMSHMWNYVKLDGKWYHVDVTWDDPTEDEVGYVRHIYFLNSDEKIGSEGEEGHYGWAAGQECDSETYDNAYWQENVSAIFTLDDGEYYLESTSIGSSVQEIALIRRNGDTKTTVCTKEQSWPVWGGSGWWTESYARLSCYNGILYFNGSSDIFAVTPGENTLRTVYTYTGGDGYLYGSLVCEKEILLGVAQNPNNKAERKRVSLPGDPVQSVVLSAEPSELYYGYQTPALLTADAELSEDVTEGPVYQWYRITGSGAGETETLITDASGKTYQVETGLEPGTYRYRVKVSASGFTVSADISLEVKNAEGTPVLTIDESYSGRTYDGTPLAAPTQGQIMISGAGYEDVNFTWYEDNNGAKGNELGSAPSDAGTYWIEASIPETDNIAAVSDEKSVTITKRTVTVTAGDYKVSKVYDGGVSAGAVSGSLGVDGILTTDSGVGVSAVPGEYDSPDAGRQERMTVELTLNGDTKGNYELGNTTVDVLCEILPKTITPVLEVKGSYFYTGSAIVPVFTVKYDDQNLTEADYTVEISNNVNAGEGRVSIRAKEGSNYTWNQAVETVFTIEKVYYKGTKTGQTAARYGNKSSFDLSAMLPAGYRLGTLSIADEEHILSEDAAVEGSVLNYTLVNDSSKAGKTAQIVIPVVETANYHPFDIEITIQVSDKLVQENFCFAESRQQKEYGESDFTIAAQGGAKGSKVVYTSSDPSVATVNADGRIHILKAGETVIRAEAGETQDYISASASYTLTVLPKVLTWDVSGLSAVDKTGTITGKKASLYGELKVTGILGTDAGAAAFNCPADRLCAVYDSVEPGERKVTLSWADAEHPVLLQGEGAENYVLPSVLPELTGKINAVIENQALLPESTANVYYRISMEGGISEVYETLKKMDNLNTPAKIEEQMRLNLQKRAGDILEKRMEVYDITLLINSYGSGWQKATAANFPKDGLTITIPYPEGTGRDTHDYVVSHLFTADINGYKAGDAEYPEVTKTEEGIRFKVYGLSPVSVGWTEAGKLGNHVEDDDDDDDDEQLPGAASASEEQSSQKLSPATGDNTCDVWCVIFPVLITAGAASVLYERNRKTNKKKQG